MSVATNAKESANFDAENAENLEAIEQQFAVAAVEQLDTYWKLLESIPGSELTLTSQDEEIFTTFLACFPEFTKEKLIKFDENELKTKENKARWRDWAKNFENSVEDFNFGCLLRTDSTRPYEQDNTTFSFRLQFYAIEIARNKLGLNDWVNKNA
ncbi:hypothetical protein ACO0SA_000994 [Hanseniaspora valbyensis]